MGAWECVLNVVVPPENEAMTERPQLLSLFTLKESVWQAVICRVYDTMMFGNRHSHRVSESV